MLSFLIKLKRRIRRLLKVQTESRQTPGTSLRSRSIRALLLVLATAMVVGLYPTAELYDPFGMPYRGDIALEDIIAPFKITVYKSDSELGEERDAIRMAQPSLVDRDEAITAQVQYDLTRFFYLVDSLTADTVWQLTYLEGEYSDIISQSYPALSEDAVRKALYLPDRSGIFELLKKTFESEIYRIGVLPDASAIPVSRGRHVLVRGGDKEGIYSVDRILRLSEANAKLLSVLNRKAATRAIDVEFAYSVGQAFLKSNLVLNEAEYRTRLDYELAAVSTVKEVVRSGEYIVHNGQKVTRHQEQILREMSHLMRDQLKESGWIVASAPMLARIVLILAALGLLFSFLFYFRRDVFNSNAKLLAILLVFGLQLVLIYLVDQANLSPYLYPVALLSIMLTIMFDAEIGILSTIVLAVLIGITHRFDFALSLMTITVGVVACFVSRRVRRRTHFFRIMAFTVVAYTLYILVVETLRLTPGGETLTLMAYGIINGAVSAFLVIGVLPFVESLFGITTDITLLELSDLNHPLLKRLALEAPGSYHHSILVGNLSESAAKAIGGNSLLARVGAYYHDIGKMEIPDYFVENQLSVKSRHETLTPSMSAIVISSHVKKGRILGEEANIPDDVLNFIEEHHGTMLMSYFYSKAIEQGVDEATADKFRYPGPKPQIRETGIVMLADAAEAASRTLDDPKPARIANLIQRIINERFDSGELDECPLTLRDLAKIKDAFVQVLTAAFHQRIAYPKSGDKS